MQAMVLHVYWQEDDDEVVCQYGEDMDQSRSRNSKMYKATVAAGLDKNKSPSVAKDLVVVAS